MPFAGRTGTASDDARTVSIKPDRAHHAVTSKPGLVAARLGCLGAVFAITRERRVDQSVVQRRQRFIADAKLFADGGGIVGDEDICLRGKTLDRDLALRFRHIDREAALVARTEHPRVILIAPGMAGKLRQMPVRISRSRRLDLDHIGAEVRQNRGRRRRCDEAAAIDHLQAFEQKSHLVPPVDRAPFRPG